MKNHCGGMKNRFSKALRGIFESTLLPALLDLECVKLKLISITFNRLKMTYQDLGIKYIYDSDEDSILEDFYIPALSLTTKYDRAVAYFSLGVLVYAIQGLDGLVKSNGKMRLIIGDTLSDDEYEAVKQGKHQKSIAERLGSKLTRDMAQLSDDLSKHRLKLLSWLVATDSLDIKFALRRSGLFHKKFGIMHESSGEKLVFQGSANETVMALDPAFNSETINVYPSWNDEIYEIYGKPYEQQFQSLWEGTNKRTITIDLPSSTYEEIKAYYRSSKPPEFHEEYLNRSHLHLVSADRGPRFPELLRGETYKLIEHQLEALRNWKESGLKGIFALATGSGKTITAIHGAVQIANTSNKKLAIVIAVPYQILAEQWNDVLSLFNIEPILCYKSKQAWYNKLDSEISNFSLIENNRFLVVVVVNATLKKAPFQALLKNIPQGNLLFIGDECHHHSTLIAKNLLPEAALRIGLSATPWSEQEEEKKQALKSYYGNIVAKYGIDKALAQNSTLR